MSLLLLGTFGISLSYGMLLLLPLYVRELGGNEADFGVVLSSAAVPAVLCIGFLIRYPEALRPHSVVALAIAVYAAAAAGASLVGGGWTPLIGVGVLLGPAWAVVYTRTGPYRFSRNPIYLAFSALQVGIALCVGSPWLLITLVPALALMSFWVIPREERYLEARFSSEYLSYKASVRRWL